MRYVYTPLIIFALMSFSPKENISEDEAQIKSIFDQELVEGKSHSHLKSLCYDVGNRLSGSAEAAKAVVWAKEKLESLNLDRVYLQEVMVPYWVRGGKEKAMITLSDGTKKAIPLLALGGSVGTGKKGIEAEVIEVKQFEDLEKLGEDKINGKIVFFNRPMNPTEISTFKAYGGCVNQRYAGAMKAAPYGAVAMIVRSMNMKLDTFPHTGSMGYEDDVKKIPGAAISTIHAEQLSKSLKKDPKLKFYLKMNCETLPDVKSHNVIGEIKGTKYPDEIIVFGGHLDSWDVGHGAHDDGAGVVQAMEVLYLFKVLNIKPERTIRCVLFMNEENGGKGADEYAKQAKMNGEKHIAAIESDRGGFTPRGFTIGGNENIASQSYAAVDKWRHLLEPYYLHMIEEGGRGGADVAKLHDQGTTLIGYIPDSQRYFDYHHTAADVFESVNKRELELGSASITALVYLISKYGLEEKVDREKLR